MAAKLMIVFVLVELWFLAWMGCCVLTQPTPTANGTQLTPISTEAATQCPVIQAPANGELIFVGSQSYKPGTVIKIECNEGYALRGNESRTCKEDGQWSDPSELACVKIKCKALPNPEHGTKTYVVNGDNVTAVFVCHKGYTLGGSDSRTCEDNLKWTGEETTCTKGQGLSTAAIVIIIVAVVLVIALIVGVSIVFYRKKRSAASRKDTRPPGGAYQPVEFKSGAEEPKYAE